MPDQRPGAGAIVERLRTAMETPDLSAFSDLLDPNVTWGAPGDPSPECQNRAQVLAWYQCGRDAGIRARVLEIVAVGDGLLVGLSVTGTDPALLRNGAGERWQVLTVAGGRIVGILGFEKREDALALLRVQRGTAPPP